MTISNATSPNLTHSTPNGPAGKTSLLRLRRAWSTKMEFIAVLAAVELDRIDSRAGRI